MPPHLIDPDDERDEADAELSGEAFNLRMAVQQNTALLREWAQHQHPNEFDDPEPRED